jgi:hypothetical protein
VTMDLGDEAPRGGARRSPRRKPWDARQNMQI